MIYFEFTYFAVFACSALICAILIWTKTLHLTAREGDTNAVQAAHAAPTPRVGGVGIGAGLLLSIFLVPDSLRSTYLVFVASLAPVFAAGLYEDLRSGVSPSMRLLAAALSSVLAIVLLGAWVSHVGVIGVDWLFGFVPIAVIFTVFATTGVCHAFNLLDGLNGLSAGTSVVTAIGLAAIAHLSGQPQMVSFCFILIAALMGFLVFNYPWGKIFLGDAGAYTMGHALAWISVILMFRVADLSPWAVVLIFFWPLADTFFAIYRRRRSGRPTNQPDRLHFHQLVMRLLEIRVLGVGKRETANPLATLVMLPFISAPVIFGVMLWDKPVWAFFAVISLGGLFVGSYLLGIRLSARRKPHAIESFKIHPAE